MQMICSLRVFEGSEVAGAAKAFPVLRVTLGSQAHLDRLAFLALTALRGKGASPVSRVRLA